MDPAARCRHGFKNPATCALCIAIGLVPGLTVSPGRGIVPVEEEQERRRQRATERDGRPSSPSDVRPPAAARPGMCSCGQPPTTRHVSKLLAPWCDTCRGDAACYLKREKAGAPLSIGEVVAELRHRDAVRRGKLARANYERRTGS